MPTAIICIGVPGSGKTTLLKKSVRARDGVVYICPDDIRFELTGNASDQTRNREVWSEAYRRIHEALEAGRDVAVDATNAAQADRLRLVEHCRLKASSVIGFWVRTPLEVCLQRNSKRSRVVPVASIKKMAKQLRQHPPSVKEGFDEVMEVMGE